MLRALPSSCLSACVTRLILPFQNASQFWNGFRLLRGGNTSVPHPRPSFLAVQLAGIVGEGKNLRLQLVRLLRGLRGNQNLLPVKIQYDAIGVGTCILIPHTSEAKRSRGSDGDWYISLRS